MATARRLRLPAALLAAALVLPLSACRPRETSETAQARPADLVLRNGAVYTVVPAQPWAQAVALSGGKIVWVGQESGAGAWIGPTTRVVDLEGKMVLPGFHDSHVHLAAGGVELSECALGELETAEAIVAAVRACAERDSGPWVRGNSWQLPAFPGANPHKSLLDAVVPDRPVFLSAADGHSAWVNSRALEIAGVTRATPDPPNGRIERDANGEPSGTLRERAIDLVSRHLPETGAVEREAGLQKALEIAARFGITSIQDASVDEEELAAYAALDRAGRLTVRTRAALYVDPEKGLAQVPGLVALRQRFRGGRLHPEAIKIFADGVIESHTAALLEPYVDTGDPGKAIWEPAALDATVAALDREGFQIHVHAIGDGAVRRTLDALERARAQNGPRDARPHIAHLQLIHPQDLPRFRTLGVGANFQALWAQEDSYIRDLTVPVLGPERSARIYPLGGVQKAGGTIVGGSDWTVSSMNPLEAIQVAVTRRAPEVGPGPAWLPDEAIDLATAVAAYTRNGAWTNFLERETGTIEAGKAADLIVLDRNLFRIPPHEIHRAKVLLTLLEGREVYRDPALAAARSRAARLVGTMNAMAEPRTDVSLLRSWIAGNDRALGQLMLLVYEDLRRFAARRLQDAAGTEDLEPAALIHEVYLRLHRLRPRRLENREHLNERAYFLALAEEELRFVLARMRKRTDRRAAIESVLEPAAPGVEVIQHVALEEALDRLAVIEPRQSRIVELRIFMGMTEEEIAGTLEVSPTTVHREWRTARRWLEEQLHSATEKGRSSTPRTAFDIYQEMDLGPGGYAIAPSTETRRGVQEALRRKSAR